MAPRPTLLDPARAPLPALHDAASLRRIEARAAALQGGDPFELMRRAGRAAWRCALRHWPQAQRIVVVCGPGNNGGDGYVLARYALDSGRDVRLVVLAGHEPVGDLARRALEDCLSRGGKPQAFEGTSLNGMLPPADLVVDALFGIGLDRAPEADAARLIEAINLHPAPRLSLDVPSGVDVARGSAPGAAVRATRTLEFIAPKAGLRTGPALDLAGALELAPLDLAPELVAEEGAVAELLSPVHLRRWLQPRQRDAHKGLFGRVLCIGGDHGRGGAVILCAEAAMRCGAGLVEVATRPAHLPSLLARRPEAMGHGVERVADVADLLDRADVVALGPGLGTEAWGRVMFGAALAAGKPLVLDADALNLLAARPRPLPPGTILTPHPGEAANLLGTDARRVQADRFEAARALCARHDVVVVLKGAGTVVAAPGRPPRILDAGNPGMAVAGMGDLLTGIIAALRAQGLAPIAAASAGVALHAGAGDSAAHDHGQRGMLPSDLLPWLRRLANPGTES
ncbi:MAG TPA: NAD(P)H-hydrate dehydratase [Xanthomonadaceae bacterium]|nr:NAD(P)H-hydrate dehydratase [Xanthomonadaceae bacterium]